MTSGSSATARFDARPPASLAQHLAEHEISATRQPPPRRRSLRAVQRPANLGPGRRLVRVRVRGVPVTMLATSAPPNTPPSVSRRISSCFCSIPAPLRSHQTLSSSLRRPSGCSRGHAAGAASAGVITVFTLRNYGYDDRRYYEHVDHVFTTSPYLSEVYRRADRTAAASGIESPIEWAEVEAPEEMRAVRDLRQSLSGEGVRCCLRGSPTCSVRNGPTSPFSWCSRRVRAGRLNAIPGLDFTRYPHIMAAPATPRPADFFALTRILLVPSTFAEPFGRVAAEALVNGIPPLVSDRGALPETVGAGGTVVPLAGLAHSRERRRLPSVHEVQPWFDAVCGLWDDPDRYREASSRARAEAMARYDEAVMRRRYTTYFESLDDEGRCSMTLSSAPAERNALASPATKVACGPNLSRSSMQLVCASI